MALNIPPVANQFMEMLGVSYGGLSILLSSYYWANMAIQVPAGLLVDRLGVVRSLVICITITIACTLAPLLAPSSLALAVASRFFIGVCSAGLFLSTLKVVKSIAPPAYISRVQGAQGAAFSLGTMLPYISLPYLGNYGWVFSYTICTLFCLFFAWGGTRLPLRALRRVRNHVTAGEVWASIKVIATSRQVWFIGLSHGMSFGVLTSVIGNWLPSILADSRPGTTIEHWALITGVLLLVGTAGRLFGGEIARKVSRGILLNRIVFVVAAMYWILALFPHPFVIITVGFLVGALCGLAYASVFTLAIDTAPPAYVATSVGFMNMVASIVNVLLVVSLGLVRDYAGSFVPGLAAWGVLAIVLWFFSRKMALTIETYR